MSQSEAVVASGFVAKEKLKEYLLFFIFPLIGMSLSVYATVHYHRVKLVGNSGFACNINQTFNCDSVALSPWSQVLGVPLGVYGLAYFLALIVLLAIGLSNAKGARDHMSTYVWTNVLGVLVSLALATISHFSLQTWCLSCIGVYVVCFLQTLFLLLQRSKFVFKIDMAALVRGSSTTLVVVVACIALHSFAKPRPSTLPPEQQTQLDQSAPLLGSARHDIVINKSPYSGFGEDYRKGSDQARVQVVEFVDFQCPSCKAMSATIDILRREYQDRVLFVFKNYPLDSSCNSNMRGSAHEFACAIAVMARCAGRFGKFWQFHDLAFAEQRDANTDKVGQWAGKVGLNSEQIKSCQRSADIKKKIKDDIAAGSKIGVEGTPTLFINGRKYLGSAQIDQLRREIDRILEG